MRNIPNAPATPPQTPGIFAAANGFETGTQLLLDEIADPDENVEAADGELDDEEDDEFDDDDDEDEEEEDEESDEDVEA